MYDLKNLMHCKRLVDVSYDIATTGTFEVFRPNHQELINIRLGKTNVKELLTDIQLKLDEIDNQFDKSDLPDTVDMEIINKLLIDIRKEYYGLY